MLLYLHLYLYWFFICIYIHIYYICICDCICICICTCIYMSLFVFAVVVVLPISQSATTKPHVTTPLQLDKSVHLLSRLFPQNFPKLHFTNGPPLHRWLGGFFGQLFPLVVTLCLQARNTWSWDQRPATLLCEGKCLSPQPHISDI